MLRKVIKIGDNTLRNKSNPISKFNDIRLNMLLRDMAQTMYKENGIGLAAPQVGITRRVIVVDVSEDRNQLIEMINPVITAKSGSCQMEEGCLSVPDRRGIVTRPEKINVVYQDRMGEKHQMQAEGLLARCIQHEVDHLNGVLYVDIMDEEVFLYEEDE